MFADETPKNGKMGKKFKTLKKLNIFEGQEVIFRQYLFIALQLNGESLQKYQQKLI